MATSAIWSSRRRGRMCELSVNAYDKWIYFTLEYTLCFGASDGSELGRGEIGLWLCRFPRMSVLELGQGLVIHGQSKRVFGT